MRATLTDMAGFKVTLDERVAAAARAAAASAGVDPEVWVNNQLARVLFLQALDRIQQHNQEPLTEQTAERVIYDS